MDMMFGLLLKGLGSLTALLFFFVVGWHLFVVPARTEWGSVVRAALLLLATMVVGFLLLFAIIRSLATH